MYQHVDIKAVLEQLDIWKYEDDKMGYLGTFYPCLLVVILRKRGKNQELAKYMYESSKKESDVENYSIYVHGYFLPWL